MTPVFSWRVVRALGPRRDRGAGRGRAGPRLPLRPARSPGRHRLRPGARRRNAPGPSWAGPPRPWSAGASPSTRSWRPRCCSSRWRSGRSSSSSPPCAASRSCSHSWEYQGRVVLVAGLFLTCLSSGRSRLPRLDARVPALRVGPARPSLGYELFVARSHLRLNARTLGALFLIVVTGVVPGLLAGDGLVGLAGPRGAVAPRSPGEPHERPRLPATMLMTLISIGGVATGVWALTVVLSVMSGFEQDLKSKILGAHAHGVVLKYGQNDFTDWRSDAGRGCSRSPAWPASTPVPLRRGHALGGPEPDRHDAEGGRHRRRWGSVTEIPRTSRRGSSSGWTAPRRSRPRGRARLYEALAGTRRAASPEQGVRPLRARAQEKLPGILLGRELARGLRVGVGDVVNVVSPVRRHRPGRAAAQEPPVPRGRHPLQRLLRVRREVRLHRSSPRRSASSGPATR